MSEIFNLSVRFEDLGLSEKVMEGVRQAGFEHPTDIQARLIPVILEGRDVIGQAKTGTGKTAAFGLPILSRADENVPMQALVLVPTRELATQVSVELDELGRATSIRSVCIIGGESMKQQSDLVQQGAQIMVGTPGRVMDMKARGVINFKNLRFAVLDEVDRMLDIGFRDDIRMILKQIKGEHQTVFVSATISGEIERLARTFMKSDAEKIVTVSGSLTVSLVDQKHLSVEPWDKRSLLLHLLRHEDPDTTVVFCRTKATVNKITKYLREKNVNAREIHGDLAQAKRTRVMDSMRKGKLDVLIATDLAARGLDIEHISHVINYDLPDDPEVYVHRIGRTARAGRTGVAWSFVCPDQGQLFTEIEKLTGVLIEKLDYSDFKPGSIPRDVQELRQQDQKRIEKSKQARADRGQPPATDGLTPEQIAERFPGGLVPKTMPSRTLGSKFRGRRGR